MEVEGVREAVKSGSAVALIAFSKASAVLISVAPGVKVIPAVYAVLPIVIISPSIFAVLFMRIVAVAKASPLPTVVSLLL